MKIEFYETNLQRRKQILKELEEKKKNRLKKQQSFFEKKEGKNESIILNRTLEKRKKEKKQIAQYLEFREKERKQNINELNSELTTSYWIKEHFDETTYFDINLKFFEKYENHLDELHNTIVLWNKMFIPKKLSLISLKVLKTLVFLSSRSTGQLSPSYQEISRKSKCSSSSVSKALKELKKYGFLKWVNYIMQKKDCKRTTNTYFLLIPDSVQKLLKTSQIRK